jgi:phosphoadenosine phosphosulfate reductase
MALTEMRISETGEVYEYSKVENSIRWLKSFEPPEGYFLAFSGGKDSCVLKALADMAGVKYDAHYRVTSVDPPELVRFIKKYHPDVSMDIPREDPNDPNSPPITMWNLIPRKRIPPTRIIRYCCEYLKESCGEGRITLTGVRWDESSRRKKSRHLVNISSKKKSERLFLMNDDADSRQEVENCYKMRKTLVNPIIDWTDEDVWEFIHEHDIPYCELYDRGYKRLGCIGCPMNTANGAKELEAYPKYKQMYLHAFERMIAERRRKGMYNKIDWSTPEKVMEWWLGKSAGYDEDQLTILELGLDDDYFDE